MKTLLTWLAAGSALAALPTAAQTVQVNSQSVTPTVLGALVAGQTYTVTATGISNLYNGYNNGLGLTFTPDGIPTYDFPPTYAAFNPNGSAYDPTSNTPCNAGAPNLCGALVGAFVPTVGSTPSFYFQLGSSYTLTADATGFLVGLVNDVGDYRDNGPEAFTVTLAAVGDGGAAVPEAATWAMMIVGFGAMGVALRRAKQRVGVTYA